MKHSQSIGVYALQTALVSLVVPCALLAYAVTAMYTARPALAAKPAAAPATASKSVNVDAELAKIAGAASAYTNKQQASVGIAVMTKKLQADAGDVQSLLTRALLKANTKDSTGALSDASAAIKIAPQSIPPYMVRSAVYSSKRDWKNAIADMSKACELNHSSDLLRSRGEIRYMSGDYAGAVVDLANGLNKQVKDAPRYYYYLLMSHRRLSDWKSAQKDAQILTELEPEVANRWELLADAAQQNGNHKAAADAYHQAGTLYMKQGSLKGAQQCEIKAAVLEKIFKINKPH